MDVSRLKNAYTAADEEGLAALNETLCGTVVAAMDCDGRILLTYEDGHAVAVYSEDGYTVFEDVEVAQC